MSKIFKKSCIYYLNLYRQLSYKGSIFHRPYTSMAESVVLPAKRQCDDDNVADAKRQCINEENASAKIRKRKVVLLLGYCGQGYLGMQRNVGYKTIEEDLVTALLKANLIREEDFNQIQNMQFQRAARTDKGVSAVRQVVSLKLPENATIEAINKYLPDAIRVFAIRRVTKGFNSKSSCDARTYSYMTPTSAFAKSDDPEKYRITPEVIDKIKETLQIFVGTHNFHNFTAKKKAQDPSAFRYIIEFNCGEPFVRNDNEFIVLHVKGQSFMLHQIRKMVGVVIGIVRGITQPDTITKAWGDDRFDLPIAPGLGLVLEQVHYDRYNSKFGKDGMHESLKWDQLEEMIHSFKENSIDPVIIETEVKEKSMLTWVETLSYHTFNVRSVHLHSIKANGVPIDDSNVEADVESVASTKSSEEPNVNDPIVPDS